MKKFLLLLLLLLLTGCGGPQSAPVQGETPPAPPAADKDVPPPAPEEPVLPEEPAEPLPPPDPRAEAVSAILAEMTLEEKVGQLFFVRCPAQGAAEAVEQYHLGGILLFGRDFKDGADNWLTEEQLRETLDSYQAAAEIPLLMGVDEEGGSVARASRNPNLFPKKCNAPQTLFARGGMDAVRDDARSKNTRLLELGINVNFAPVADVSTDPGDFIYDRTLGQDAQATADYVRTVVEEMNAAGVGAVLKHFPGYGGNRDTHTGAAVDDRPLEQFRSADFLPFSAGIQAGAGSVLVSHNVVTAVDDQLPASLSPAVHRLLREELGFTGVILTDDLAMAAVEDYAREGSAAVLAILAGNDMVVTTDFQTQIPLVLDAVAAGTIPEELLEEAAGRVLGWKYDLGLLEDNA